MAGSDQIMSLYVNAAKGAPGRYFIGPFGRRVSFASQQQRALNTVWALKESGLIREGQDIAVIGAGLSGVMAATALANLGCSVWIFESRTRPLERQSRTNHRWIHPSINFWPLQELEATTHFPYYDWFADQCSQVVRSLEKDWERLSGRITDIFTSTSVQSVTDRDGKQIVSFRKYDGAPQEMDFDSVVFSVGFGDEKTVTGSDGTSYWDEDDLFSICRSSKPIVIAGSGDGGIIDALRSVHSQFRWGRLPVELAEKLHSSGVFHKMKLAEEEASQETIELSANAVLAKHYPKIFQALDGNSRALLDGSIYKPTVPVRLVGTSETPYSLRSAPIHRLMIAHAIHSGAVVYEKGELVDGPAVKHDDGTLADIKDSYCVARLGPVPPLHTFLDQQEVGQLKSRQEALSDLVGTTPYSNDYWKGFDDYPQRDEAGLDFARRRLSLAAHYVTDTFGLRLGLGRDEEGAFYAISKPMGQSSIRIPEHIFGIRAVAHDEELFDALA